ncbi:MAG: hypothetical protein GY839_19710, partial [candidate division Zixibacteria bacterium]|nr:hypothetical protein [candidate division Zixibacteria bacterium]
MITNNAIRRLAKSNTGSVLILSVVLSFASVLLGAAYLQYSFHQRIQVSYDIAKSMAFNAAYAALTLGMKENADGGSEYTSPIEEFYRDGERYVVEYNYRCLVMSEDSVGFSTTSNYVVEG